jgi:hypothetical protein
VAISNVFIDFECTLYLKVEISTKIRNIRPLIRWTACIPVKTYKKDPAGFPTKNTSLATRAFQLNHWPTKKQTPKIIARDIPNLN